MRSRIQDNVINIFHSFRVTRLAAVAWRLFFFFRWYVCIDVRFRLVLWRCNSYFLTCMPERRVWITGLNRPWRDLPIPQCTYAPWSSLKLIFITAVICLYIRPFSSVNLNVLERQIVSLPGWVLSISKVRSIGSFKESREGTSVIKDWQSLTALNFFVCNLTERGIYLEAKRKKRSL